MWRTLVIVVSFAMTIWLAITVFGDDESPKLASPTSVISPETASGTTSTDPNQIDRTAAQLAEDVIDTSARRGSAGGDDTAQAQGNTLGQQALEPPVLSSSMGSIGTAADPSSNAASIGPDQLGPRTVDSSKQATKQSIAVDAPPIWVGTRALVSAPLERPAPSAIQPQSRVPVTPDTVMQKPPRILAPTKADVEAPPADQRRVRVNIPEEVRRQ